MAADWCVPDNPDPAEIMHSGWKDARAGHYEVALAKFIWFHENALAFKPALSAVRLSFAIGYWHELAKAYPPAMAALQQARNQAESSFLHDGYQFEKFQELTALNRELGTPKRTVEIFKHVAHRDNSDARYLYLVAERALIDEEEFSLCNYILEPEQRLRFALQGFRDYQVLEPRDSDSRRSRLEYALTRLVDNLARVIALLVINNRMDEAHAVADGAQDALPDFQVYAELESALAGQFPPARS